MCNHLISLWVNSDRIERKTVNIIMRATILFMLAASTSLYIEGYHIIVSHDLLLKNAAALSVLIVILVIALIFTFMGYNLTGKPLNTKNVITGVVYSMVITYIFPYLALHEFLGSVQIIYKLSDLFIVLSLIALILRGTSDFARYLYKS